jgi:hypothetical protein
MADDTSSVSPQKADEILEAAATGAQSSALALRNWDMALRELRGMYEENGFGRSLKQIMKMSVRET